MQPNLKQDSYYFNINYVYKSKYLKLVRGHIAEHRIGAGDAFEIEVIREMEDLLFIRTLVDSLNIEFCLHFNFNDNPIGNQACQF